MLPALEVHFDGLQLMGSLALHPVISRWAGLAAEVQSLPSVLLSVFTVGAI